MAVFRAVRTSGFTVMSNTHLRDKNLSLRAKGLLSLMLSLPEDWDYSVGGLVSICRESKQAVDGALRELKTAGYLVITKRLPSETASGRIEYEYCIYEQPRVDTPEPDPGEQDAAIQDTVEQDPEKQDPEKQDLEFQELENQPQLNTKIPNTDESNTDKQNKEKEIYCAVITHLNEKTGSHYRPDNKATQRHINARIAEGYGLDSFKAVIDKKTEEWRGTEWEKYLRPETLFGPKFEGYLNAPRAAPRGARGSLRGDMYAAYDKSPELFIDDE